MTMPTRIAETAYTVSDRADRCLDVAEATLTGALGRCDGKASVLLGLTGAGLTVIISNAARFAVPTPVLVIGVIGLAAWLAAVVALLLTIRPHLRNADRASWSYWSSLTPEEIREQLAHDRRPHRVRALSVMARTKFRYLRLAVDLMLAGLVLHVVATLVAIAL